MNFVLFIPLRFNTFQLRQCFLMRDVGALFKILRGLIMDNNMRKMLVRILSKKFS